ncbi:MAG: aminoacyl-histidine dipeptidase [Clostridium sp.]
MLEQLKNLKSYEVFKYFKEMNEIPRGSGNEKAISDWLVDFAKSHGFEYIQDEALNVIIKKPGTKGYENSPVVVLQGHMDMVCEKNADTVHDFEKDIIKFIVEGDTLRADGTTLGADNGIALAFGLAVLASKDVAHAPIELLATSDEEAGMGGAQSLDPKDITGRTLINIDSEEEGILLVSCAGGVRQIISLPIVKEPAPSGYVKKTIRIRGLKGGHSGMEINKERGNSNKLMGRFLNDLRSSAQFNVASIMGGSKMNAIPRESDSVIFIEESKIETLNSKIKEWNEILKVELNAQDPDVNLTVEDCNEEITEVFNCDTTGKVIDIIMLTPNGIQTMSMAIKGLVESSNNLGVIVTEGNYVKFENCVRSSVRTLKEQINAIGTIIAKSTEAEIEFISDYPAWQYRPDSKLRETFVDVYEKTFGNKPEISAIHAGLECGLFGGKFGSDMDMISFGPNIYDVHTPDEHISIESTDRMYQYLLEVLKELK